ncbi:hypothetical protein [Methylotenera sp.]|uniref:hypothetical protein n=1 Tax=Methylotenera sp. TaxID=2051956 RepID=UPI002715B23F|nr:hypothetical protein [Methylotenera sp.]MDO9204060.1 hypothetical protein [Methylotenera sp.]
MLDSFNNEDQSDTKNAFIAREHINSLCLGGRIQINPHIQIDYRKGWATLIEELIDVIKKYPIEIKEISSDYGQLDVNFYCIEKTQELRIWRAIDEARNQSRHVCSECGETGMRKIRGDKVIVICRACIRKAEDNGVTGTWLDKY